MAKILIVDDAPDTVDLVKVILKKEGYNLVEADNGQEAIDQWRKENPDLILLDIMMPDKSGWDVYQEIRKEDKDVKISFLSVIEVSEDRKKTLIDEGLSDYIIKPFTSDELVKRVNAILKK